MAKQERLREAKQHGAAWFPFNIYPCTIPKDFPQVALHWQDSMELVFVKKGRGIVQAGLTTYTAQAGDIYVFAPGVLHALRQLPGEAMEYENIIFELELLGGAGDICAEKYLLPLQSGRLALPMRLGPEDWGYNWAVRCLHAAEEFNKIKDVGYELCIKGELLLFLAALVDSISGGGGLISGVACAIKSLNPKVKVYGVQAENAPSMKRSLEAGEAITLDSVRTFADGIAVKHPGDITLDMVRKYVDEVVTVSEDEIAAAILALMEKQKLVAEGAGAVTVAAAMFGKLPIAGKKVCCLISGGNIDVNILSRVITRGLQREGRNCLLTIALDDKPGQLLGVTQVISECGANIVGVTHERSDAAYAVTSCLLRISMETRDFAQIEEIKAKLKEQGFKLVE